ncbi:MAG: hypothetical protein ACKO8M_17415 [Microcystis panniformis]
MSRKRVSPRNPFSVRYSTDLVSGVSRQENISICFLFPPLPYLPTSLSPHSPHCPRLFKQDLV